MTERAIIVAGRSFHTRVDGDPSAAWLVLSNSLAADLSMWDAQIPFLTERFRVLRYDTRGHGKSDAPAGPYGWDDLVGDAIGVMDGHAIAQASFLGLSLGAMTGVGLALSHPERVSSLICCAARMDAPEAVVRGWDERIDAVRKGGMAAGLDSTMARWLTPATIARDPGLAARVGAMITSTDPTGYAGCAAAIKTIAYVPQLPHLVIPTLFVAGQYDTGAPAAVMSAMSALVPGSVMAVIPDAAHIVNLDNPPSFEQAVTAFLSGQPSQAALRALFA